MKCHIIVGMPGTGKSTFVFEILDRIPNKKTIFVYDVENEYKKYFPYPLLDFNEFINKITPIKKAVIVFEESTIFLSNRSFNQQVQRLITQKRHTGNYLLFIFHSVRAIPYYIYDSADYLTLFKTNDTVELINYRFRDRNVNNAWHEVNNNNDFHFKKTLRLK